MNHLKEILQIMRTDGIGPRGYLDLIQKFKTPDRILKNAGYKFTSLGDVEDELKKIEKFGAQIIDMGSGYYPPALAQIAYPPILLTVKGNLDLLTKPMIGIVGARNASSAGRSFAKKIAKELSCAGYVVVSGLARGIDASAHEGAIGEGTIGVVGNGVDVFYPLENKELQELMFEKGLVVSEFPFGSAPQTGHFPQRNRIISGLCRGVLVVEAALKSGSLITAHMALDQGREVMAVPGSPLDPRCRGTNKLIKEGAKLIETIDDVFAAFGDTFEKKPQKPRENHQMPKIPLESDRASVLESLSYTPIPVDQVVLELNLPPNTVRAILLELELEEKIERHPGNKVSFKTTV